jgi:cell division protein FtsW
MNAALAFAQEFVRGHDRKLIASGAMLLLAGFLFALTASPASVARMGYESSFALGLRHGGLALAAAVVALGACWLPAVTVRRTGVFLFLATLVLLAVTLAAGPEINGARRWLSFGPLSLQTSEFAKPALVITMAWMLSAGVTQRGFPGASIAIALYAVTAVLLAAQPDYGQTALLGLVLVAMLYLSGASLRTFGAIGAAALVAGLAAWRFVPHVRARIDAFLDPEKEAFQVERALQAIASGGPLGRGPGEGVVNVPDAHADFVYAAAAEEFGWLASIGFVALYVWIAWYGLRRASRLVDPFAQIAASGLILLFTLQATIHIAVNADLIPAKGMTLPLVSYGGSALLGSALTLGFALALLRDRPGAFLHDRPDDEGET